MRLGDMTFKQIAEICAFHGCDKCPFCTDRGSCMLLNHIPSAQNLNMVVKTDAED